jgi:hypothetical protein
MILPTNYHRINVAPPKFIELILLSFRKLQSRIEKIRTSYIDCKVDRLSRAQRGE